MMPFLLLFLFFSFSAAVADFLTWGRLSESSGKKQRSAPFGSAVPLRAPENMQVLTSTQWRFLRGNTSEEPAVWPQGPSISPLEDLRK